ncbi:hypothetical protein GCM10023100_39930 [Actinocorallia cavernae]|uniref:Uncharacterized protein n=2 Tax=Actinomycetes TaxID=1760 RepID=A0ABN3MB02_9ACTN
MTDAETSTRSLARAHLSQLIDMFGTDGCLRLSTTPAPDLGSSAPAVASDGGAPGDDEHV